MFFRFLKLVLFCLLAWSTVHAEDLTPEQQHVQEMLKLQFNPDYTHGQTKENFLKNLARDCKGFGYGKIIEDERISSMAILETYPKEIALKYFKENYKELCYYGFSLVVNYLLSDYKSKLDGIINQVVGECLRNPKSLPLCDARKKEFFYTNLSSILNQLCTPDAHNNFKKLYCEFTEIKREKCEFYPGKSYKNCPEYQAHMAELEALFKVFFSSNCRKFPKRKPRCK